MGEALPGIGKMVDGLMGETRVKEIDAGRRTLEEVEFAGEKVELRSAEIVSVMIRVQEALGNVKVKQEGGKERGMKGWDRVLGVLGEAEGIARSLMEDHEVGQSWSGQRRHIIGIRLSNIPALNQDISIIISRAPVHNLSSAITSNPQGLAPRRHFSAHHNCSFFRRENIQDTWW